MRFLHLFFIIAFLSIAACRDAGPAPAKIKDDRILADYNKEVRRLQEEVKILQQHTQETKKRLKDLTMNPKIAELLKKGVFQNQKFLEQIDQRISFIKIQIANRESYLEQNKASLTQELVDQQFADYKINKKANPASSPWKSTPLTDLDNPGAPKSLLDGNIEVVEKPDEDSQAPASGAKPVSDH